MQGLWRKIRTCGMIVLLCISSVASLAQRDQNFRPSASRVLRMAPRQFVDYYAAHVEGSGKNYRLGSYCGGSFRNAMCYYAECLHKRTNRRSKTLTRPHQQKFRRLQTVVEEWLSSYYAYYMLFNINGTFWCDAWAVHYVSSEQILAEIERSLKQPNQITTKQFQDLGRELTAIRRELIPYTIKQVYEISDRKRFMKSRQQVLKATDDLKATLKLLPSNNASSLLRLLRTVREEVINCATPAVG